MGRKITEEEFNLQVSAAKTRQKNPVEILTSFIDFNGVHSTVECRCPKCSGLFFSHYSNIAYRGSGCKKCARKKVSEEQKFTEEQWQNFVLFCLNKGVDVITEFHEYTNNKNKLKFRCNKCNCDFLALKNNLKKQGCPKCKAINTGDRKRLSEKQYEQYVGVFLKNQNIIVQTKYDEYRRGDQKLNCLCKTCNSICTPTLDSLRRGGGCLNCRRLKAGEIRRISLEKYKQYVKTSLSQKNILVLTEYQEYRNCHTKVYCLCRTCNNHWNTKFSNIMSGKGCPRCGRSMVGKANRLTFEEYNQLVHRIDKKQKIIVLTEYTEYHDTKSKINCLCIACDNRWTPTLSDLQTGCGCPRCGRSRTTLARRLSCEQYVNKTEWVRKNKNIVVLTEYDGYHNNATNVSCLCLRCNNTWTVSFHSLSSGTGCPKCCFADTKPEKTLFEFLSKKVGVASEQRNRKVLKGLEIDLFCGEAKFGVEFHGNHWHSSTRKENYKIIHTTKYNLAKEAGIDLIQIFEDEYASNPDLIHSIIRAKVDKPMYTYDAASCTPGSITEENLKAFMAANSFESYDEYDARVELADGSKTLAVLLWRKDEDAIRFKYVVARDTKVTGGLQRLLDTITPFYPGCALEATSDARYSLHDKELKECGFIWSHITEPDRFYCVDNYKTRIPAMGKNADNLPEIYGVGYNVFRYTALC